MAFIAKLGARLRKLVTQVNFAPSKRFSQRVVELSRFEGGADNIPDAACKYIINEDSQRHNLLSKMLGWARIRASTLAKMRLTLATPRVSQGSREEAAVE